MRIIVPMAGRGSRLAAGGLQRPKPLIELHGRPMVAWALDGLSDLLGNADVTFVVLKAHDEQFGATPLLRQLVAGGRANVVAIDTVTDGQVCTVLAAREFIDAGDDLLIASCDTYVISPLASDIRHRTADCHGIISVADMPGESWSFAAVDGDGRVTRVAEKQRISSHASTGLYYFSRGGEFLEAADEMIRRDERTRGEFYVMPIYQKFIDRGWRVEISRASEMRDMGSLEGIRDFAGSNHRGRD